MLWYRDDIGESLLSLFHKQFMLHNSLRESCLYVIIATVVSVRIYSSKDQVKYITQSTKCLRELTEWCSNVLLYIIFTPSIYNFKLWTDTRIIINRRKYILIWERYEVKFKKWKCLQCLKIVLTIQNITATFLCPDRSCFNFYA